jgi:hypothetical protein
VGDVADATGWLEVVPDHEWDAFHHVDVRNDWMLAGIFLVQHQQVPVDATGEIITRGGVVAVTAPNEVLREADTRPGSQYLVDLAAESP